MSLAEDKKQRYVWESDDIALDEDGQEKDFFNPNHQPAGSEKGGEFAPKDGSSDLDDESTPLGARVAGEASVLESYLPAPEAATLARHSVEWSLKLEINEEEVVKGFTSDRYHDINHCLRHGDACDESIHADAATLLSTLNKSDMPVDLQVYRGLNYKTKADLAHLKVGATFSDKGFVSTTLHDSGGLGQGPGDNTATFVIDVPKGSKAGYLFGGLTVHETEREVLLPANSRFEVTDVSLPGQAVVVHVRLIQ